MLLVACYFIVVCGPPLATYDRPEVCWAMAQKMELAVPGRRFQCELDLRRLEARK